MAFFTGIIDVYDENPLDFVQARACGVTAILHETSRGTYEVDSAYRDRKAAAKSRGFLWGAYHLLSAENVHDQLQAYLAIEDGGDTSIIMAIDWESSSSGTMDYDHLRAFVQAFRVATQRWPMLYGGYLLRETPGIVQGDDLLANCPLWYSRLTSGPLQIPVRTWPNYALWQFDDEHRKFGGPDPSILPGADWNRFDGPADELRARWPFM